MKNLKAVKVNEKLGCKVLNESNIYGLTVNVFTKKQVKEMCIDDLIDSSGKATPRLAQLVKEISE